MQFLNQLTNYKVLKEDPVLWNCSQKAYTFLCREYDKGSILIKQFVTDLDWGRSGHSSHADFCCCNNEFFTSITPGGFFRSRQWHFIGKKGK